MKTRKLGNITPYFFEENLLIPLSKKWIEVFQGIPTFDVVIDKKKRLVLVSSTIRSGDLNE